MSHQLSIRSHKGFTLIELIAVMVVLSVIAGLSTQFVVSSMKNIRSVSEKNSLLSESNLATEYMIRRLRNALPYSVREVNGGSCLEFMPIVSGGLYRDVVPSAVNGAFANGNTVPIRTAPFSVSGGSAQALVIGASATTELYGVLPGSLANIESSTATTVTLAVNKQWLRNSINQRFFIVDKPSAFCITSNELRLYRDLDVIDDDVSVSGGYDLLSQSVSEFGDAFSISSAIEDRNIRISLSLKFSRGDSYIDMLKEVLIRNVP